LIDQARSAAQRAAALTRQLLAFARKQTLEPRIVDLNDLVLGMDKLLRRALGEDVEVTNVLASDLWSVEIDPGQFEQVLLNLAINARDSMPQGGNLSIETGNIVLEEHAGVPGLEPGIYVMLSVRDTGQGMTEEVRRRAFEPFFTTKEGGQGSGLGLASCHGIVRQAGGHILLTSALGHGTEVRIYLPRALGVPDAQENPPLTAPPRGRETLLVVEDHDLLRALVVRSLATQGYKVLVAASAAEALELSTQTADEIDLLVTDVVMPHMSGLALAAKLLESRPYLPALYVSGHSEQNVMREHGAGSYAAFLAKPFTMSELSRKVREVLAHAAQQDQPRLRVAR
jgi:two-component system, cell cycle sensor histidine kinase and response regulator CckA